MINSDEIKQLQDYDMVPPEEYQRLGKEIADAIDQEAIDEINDVHKPEGYESVSEYVKKNRTKLDDDDVTLYPKPRRGCHYCHGTGKEGYNFYSGEPQICRCILRKLFNPLIKTTEFMTWKEFSTLMLSRIPEDSRKTPHVRPKRLRRSLGKKRGKYEKIDIVMAQTVHQEASQEETE
jgi:hypothetical protein